MAISFAFSFISELHFSSRFDRYDAVVPSFHEARADEARVMASLVSLPSIRRTRAMTFRPEDEPGSTTSKNSLDDDDDAASEDDKELRPPPST